MCFTDMSDAERALQILDNAQIKAKLAPVSSKRFRRELFPVLLDEVKWDDALKLIDDAHIATTVRCPDCHSHNVEFPQTPQASAVFHAVAKMGELITGKQSFYCHACHHQWSEQAVEKAAVST